jgi:hypothetical protein
MIDFVWRDSAWRNFRVGWELEEAKWTSVRERPNRPGV